MCFFFLFQMFGFPTDLFGMPAGTNHRSSHHSLVPHQQALFGHSMMMPSPFGAMHGLFNDFGMHSSPFAMLDQMMQTSNDSLFHGGNSSTSGPMHSFSSTTVMSYSGSDGQPKVYQQSTSHSRGPGGIEETRQAIRDPERGINKVNHWSSVRLSHALFQVHIGHRIGDRKHVVERELNAATGQISENVELENLEEEQTDEFKREWRARSARADLVRRPHHPHHQPITSSRHYQPTFSSHPPQLAIEHGAASNRHHQKSSRHTSHPRPAFHYSDTIDLTHDSPIVEEVEELPLPQPVAVKRKASSSSSAELDTQRKHRQNRV